MSVLPSVAQLDARPISRVFRALADETRVRIVAMLGQGELCVCHIERALEMKQPTVSRHLSVLRAAGMVDFRRDGSWIYYRLIPLEPPALQAAVEGVTTLADPRLLRADLVRLKKSCGPGACT
jgi:ArsR family transcriptional regulator